MVLETAQLNEAELVTYCRSKGLFAEQIAAWREACQEANAQPADRHRAQQEQTKNDRREIKQLKKDLQRKEKALAEAAALIILRKKPWRFGGFRGRLIGTPDRQLAMELIEEAVGSGCRRAQACTMLDSYRLVNSCRLKLLIRHRDDGKPVFHRIFLKHNNLFLQLRCLIYVKASSRDGTTLSRTKVRLYKHFPAR